ncbi:MAG: hypothetical protein H7832_12760, partial [Magnetococcus sp. DMHC-6]
ADTIVRAITEQNNQAKESLSTEVQTSSERLQAQTQAVLTTIQKQSAALETQLKGTATSAMQRTLSETILQTITEQSSQLSEQVQQRATLAQIQEVIQTSQEQQRPLWEAVEKSVQAEGAHLADEQQQFIETLLPEVVKQMSNDLDLAALLTTVRSENRQLTQIMTEKLDVKPILTVLQHQVEQQTIQAEHKRQEVLTLVQSEGERLTRQQEEIFAKLTRSFESENQRLTETLAQRANLEPLLIALQESTQRVTAIDQQLGAQSHAAVQEVLALVHQQGTDLQEQLDRLPSLVEAKFSPLQTMMQTLQETVQSEGARLSASQTQQLQSALSTALDRVEQQVDLTPIIGAIQAESRRFADEIGGRFSLDPVLNALQQQVVHQESVLAAQKQAQQEIYRLVETLDFKPFLTVLQTEMRTIARQITDKLADFQPASDILTNMIETVSRRLALELGRQMNLSGLVSAVRAEMERVVQRVGAEGWFTTEGERIHSRLIQLAEQLQQHPTSQTMQNIVETGIHELGMTLQSHVDFQPVLRHITQEVNKIQQSVHQEPLQAQMVAAFRNQSEAIFAQLGENKQALQQLLEQWPATLESRFGQHSSLIHQEFAGLAEQLRQQVTLQHMLPVIKAEGDRLVTALEKVIHSALSMLIDKIPDDLSQKPLLQAIQQEAQRLGHTLEEKMQSAVSGIAAKQEIQNQKTETRLESVRQEAATRLDAVRQETARLEAATRQETIRQETIRQEAIRQEATRQETIRQEALRQEIARQEKLAHMEQTQMVARQEAARKEAERRLAAVRQETQRLEEASKEEMARLKATQEKNKLIEATRQEALARKEANAKLKGARQEAERLEALARQEMARSQAAQMQIAQQRAARREAEQQEAIKKQQQETLQWGALIEEKLKEAEEKRTAPLGRLSSNAVKTGVQPPFKMASNGAAATNLLIEKKPNDGIGVSSWQDILVQMGALGKGIDGATLLELLKSMHHYIYDQFGDHAMALTLVLENLIGKLQGGMPISDPNVVILLKEIGERSDEMMNAYQGDAPKIMELDKGFMKAANSLRSYVEDLLVNFAKARRELQTTQQVSPRTIKPTPPPTPSLKPKRGATQGFFSSFLSSQKSNETPATNVTPAQVHPTLASPPKAERPDESSTPSSTIQTGMAFIGNSLRDRIGRLQFEAKQTPKQVPLSSSAPSSAPNAKKSGNGESDSWGTLGQRVFHTETSLDKPTKFSQSSAEKPVVAVPQDAKKTQLFDSFLNNKQKEQVVKTSEGLFGKFSTSGKKPSSGDNG